MMNLTPRHTSTAAYFLPARKSPPSFFSRLRRRIRNDELYATTNDTNLSTFFFLPELSPPFRLFPLFVLYRTTKINNASVLVATNIVVSNCALIRALLSGGVRPAPTI